MPPFLIDHLSALKKFEGREVSPTDWFILAQNRIEKFADTTEDQQWIHVDWERASRESPSPSTIAYAFLRLSLRSYFCKQME